MKLEDVKEGKVVYNEKDWNAALKDKFVTLLIRQERLKTEAVEQVQLVWVMGK